jgi:diketogulonate reductase-like aldo/keto reductase
MKIPATGFGTWKILLNGRAKRAVTEALDAGYRLIDTAMIYGNEKGVGAAVRSTSVPRDEIYLTTKLWNSYQGYETALQAFDMSLNRLGVDYVDLYLIHWPRSSALTKASWKALEELNAAGLAKNIGLSNYEPEEIKELLSYAEVRPAVNQIEFHPFIYESQKPTLDYCRSHGIAVEAYSPLARARAMDNPVIEAIAETTGRTKGQVMLRWALQHGTVPIPKTSHKERMKDNLDIFDFELSKEQMKELNSLSTGRSVI